MPARNAVVIGRVQGVGFRYYVLDRAVSKGVGGEVWNRTDGAVELVYFHAEIDVLDEFGSDLWRGPGRVEAVQIRDWDSDAYLEDFRIGRTRP